MLPMALQESPWSPEQVRRSYARFTLFACAALYRRSRVFTIQLCNELALISLGKLLAFVRMVAITESFCIHYGDHFAARGSLVPDDPAAGAIDARLRSSEKHGRSIWTGRAHAPHPMQAAASIARSASCLGIGIEFASGAEPARSEMKSTGFAQCDPARCDRLSSLRSGNDPTRNGSTVIVARPRTFSCKVHTPRQRSGPCGSH